MTLRPYFFSTASQYSMFELSHTDLLKLYYFSNCCRILYERYDENRRLNTFLTSFVQASATIRKTISRDECVRVRTYCIAGLQKQFNTFGLTNMKFSKSQQLSK